MIDIALLTVAIALPPAGPTPDSRIASAAPVHEEAVLTAAAASVAASGTLELKGAEFGANETYTLVLRGVLDEHALGEVEVDSTGTFTLQVTVPRGARPGGYQVVAIAPDGDVVARVDLTVTAAPAGGTEGAAGPGPAMGESGMAGMEGGARSDEIEIARDRSGIEWLVIGLAVGLAGGLGIGLARRPAA